MAQGAVKLQAGTYEMDGYRSGYTVSAALRQPAEAVAPALLY